MDANGQTLGCCNCGADTFGFGDVCAGCCTRECDRCGGEIALDEDIWVQTIDNDDLNVCENCVDKNRDTLIHT
jgi:hypothetical protein